MRCMGVASGSTHATLKDHKVCVHPLRYSDHAEVRAASTVSVATGDLVDSMDRRIDGTGETIAPWAVANDLDTPGGHLLPERCSRLQIDRVPRQFNEGVSTMVCVGACNIRTPVTIWIRT